MASLDYAARLYSQCGTFLMDVSQQWPSNKEQGLHASLEAIALRIFTVQFFHANLTFLIFLNGQVDEISGFLVLLK